MRTRSRTLDELRADSKHVLYEAQQLDDVVKGLAGFELKPPEEGRPPIWMVNALLNDIGLHARALLSFLYDKPRDPYPDDVLAVDYLPEWPSVRPPESEFLREVRKRVGEEMAHITRRRATIPDELRGWSFGKVHTEVGEVLREFIVRVPEDRVRPDWRRDAWRTLPAHVRSHKHFNAPPPPPGSPPPPPPGRGGSQPIDLSPSQAALEAAARATKGRSPGGS